MITLNGDLAFELDAPPGGSVEEELVTRLWALNGENRYSLLLWKRPEGVPFYSVDIDRYPEEYIQTAGDFDGRMTAEVREIVDGTAQQYVIGRVSEGDADAPDEVVPWNGHEARVRANEVLTGDEVSEIFISYFHTGELPRSYQRRRLDL